MCMCVLASVGGAEGSRDFTFFIANPRKLEHGFRRIRARIPYTLS